MEEQKTQEPAQPTVAQPGAEPVPASVQSFIAKPDSQKPLEAHHTHHFLTSVLLVIIVVLVVLAGGLGFLLFKGSSMIHPSQNPKAALPTISVAPTVTPTPDLTAAWQMYDNSELGYTLKYPENYKATEPVVSETTNIVFSDTTSSTDSFMVHVYTGKNLESYKKTHAWWLEKNQLDPSDVMIGGVPGRRFTYKPVGDTTDIWDIVLVEKDGKAYEYWVGSTNTEQGLKNASTVLTTMSFKEMMPAVEVSTEPGSISPAVTP